MYVQTSFKPWDKTYNPLFDAIDVKIAQIATILLNNIRYGLNSKVDYEKYEDLKRYKKIINGIIYLSNGMCDIDVLMVVNKIRNLTNALC